MSPDGLTSEMINGVIDRLIDTLVAEGLPADMPLFSKAWLGVRRDLPDNEPRDCLLLRRVVLRFFDELTERYPL